MRFQAPRGTNDVLPGDSHRWIDLENQFRSLAALYGYREIRTPVFEETDLFVRSSGETSDIVSKQMYSFEDKGGRNITLKPEGTAPAMRAVIEHNLCPQGTVARLSYVTPIFRYERPQKGRYRQAHQVGLELLGSASPAADAEIVEMTVRFYERLGLPGVQVLLNSLGRDECRTRFREAILQHAEPYLRDQSDEVRAKAQKNPLRLLDSKDPAVHEALSGVPPVTDFLEEESQRRFDELQALLSEAGVPYRVAPEIVRGLDYYTETVFEVQSSKLGAQSALCGGGRYDDLIRQLGGPQTPAVGVGMGIERALMVLEEEGLAIPVEGVDVYLVLAGPEAAVRGRELVRTLRESGISVVLDLEVRSLKAQLRQADRSGARHALILGEDELAKGTVQVRHLASGEQGEEAMDGLAKRLGRG
jgi:histidyl-tRNA synthetase